MVGKGKMGGFRPSRSHPFGVMSGREMAERTHSFCCALLLVWAEGEGQVPGCCLEKSVPPNARVV